jgi:hypothetical protein
VPSYSGSISLDGHIQAPDRERTPPLLNREYRMPMTVEDMKWAQEAVSAIQAACPHDVGRTENSQKFQGEWIMITQCPKCGMYNPPPKS